MASIYMDQGNQTIVATCAFCGRWRDSLGEWHTPPSMVAVMVEQKIIELSHTYCPPCLREHSDSLGGPRIADKIADAQEAKRQMRPHDPDDLVHNLIQSLCTPVANAQSRASA